jgi:hypothetical protein
MDKGADGSRERFMIDNNNIRIIFQFHHHTRRFTAEAPGCCERI